MFKHAPRVVLAALCVAATANLALAQGNPAQNPNSQKYSNTGAKPATGRSGSASLEARVMIGKDGKMLVETSTGGVEQASGPGILSKVQVKFGEFTKNFNNLAAGGYFSTEFPAAARGSSIQVQGNVRGIDPKRTDVVTVSTPAVLRPDVAVDSVAGPAQQMKNAQATFVATLSEKNGDLGAGASCVLSVNGTEVDTASGIWVDAGDSVNCQFAHSFAQPGTYTISVAATQVTPGDWDTANNQAQTTITIIEPEKKIAAGSLEAVQENSSYSNYWQYYYCCWYAYYGQETRHRNLSTINFNGSRSGGSPLMQQVTASINVNGSLAHQVTLSPNKGSSYDNGYSFNQCSEYSYESWNGSGYTRSADRAQMCTGGVHGNPNSQWTNYHYSRNTGAVTYYGYNGYCSYYWYWNGYYWQQYWYCYPYWTWNNQDTYGGGINTNWAPGNEIRVKLKFLDNSGIDHTADRAVTLTNVSHEVNWNHYWTWSSGNRYRGYVSWNDPQ